jgi:type 1 glutamine amidotransferase
VIAVCIGIAWLMIGDAGQVAASGAQPPPVGAVTAAQAAPFAGEWIVSVTSQMGPMTFTLAVSADDRTVRATVASSTQPAANVTDISLVRGSLLLKYSSDYQGTPIPTVMTLTPRGQDLLVAMSVMDGQFEMSGTAAKGRSAAQNAGGRPAPATAPQAGVRAPQPQVARVADLIQMMAALPDSAPAAPKRPRRVLVLARAAGFVHSSIPLAARTIEALGQKTGAWTTVITYNAAEINRGNLEQYDAIFLASTTGQFLDDPADQAVTASRRNALLDFVRGGKGIGAIHAATDSYHGNAPGAPAPAPAGGRAPVDGGTALWPEFNRLIGGYFKFHWLYPTQIAVKIDDPTNPINAPFTSLNQQTGVRLPRPFSIADEVYTFNEESWSRERAHVLTSIDYAKMPAEVKAQEPAPQRTDHDYALSYIQREGKGRVFVAVLGHDESIYKHAPMLAHILAGMQYVLGDLEADDSPSAQAGK